MNKPDNFGGRIAFVDYEGKQTFENYKKNPPTNKNEEIEFVKKNAPRMVKGVEELQEYVAYLKE